MAMFCWLARRLLEHGAMTTCSLNETTTNKTWRPIGCGCILPVFVLLLTLTTSALAEIIPAGRRIQWDPGVRGDIRNRTTVFANVKNAPYSAKGDGVADDTAAIQNAINACPSDQVVYVPAGTYKISSTLQVKSGVTLRGAGMKITVIKGAYPFTGDSLLVIDTPGWDSDYSQSPSMNLTSSGLTKGSTSITTSAPHGWSAGDYILIDQLENPSADPPIDHNGTGNSQVGSGCAWCGRASGTRPIGQWAKIVSTPTSTTATIDPPLYFNYDINFTPQGVKSKGVTQSVGIEDMSWNNSVSDAFDTTRLFFAVNCWFLRVEIQGNHRRGIWAYGGMWNTIRGCTVHGGIPELPVTTTNPSNYMVDHAYGLFLGPWPTAYLVEDNIWYNLVMAVAFEGCDSGNVFAYNYATNMLWFDVPNGRMAVLGHGAGSMFNLVEGNVLYGRFGVDSYWGTQHYFTLLRNRIFQQSDRYEQTWTIDIDRRSWYQNLVGNVLGQIGQENTYEMNDVTYATYPYDYGPVAIYRLGYDTIRTDTVNYDTAVKKNILRHGNWDGAKQTTVWDSAITDKTVPASYYLAGKPSWWGNLSWPPIGSDLSPMGGLIPAQVRFSGAPIPLPPANLRLVSP